MNKTLKFAILLWTIVLAAGCKKEITGNQGQEHEYTQPEGFAELVRYHMEGRIFSEARDGGESVTLYFYDEHGLDISSFEIHDCSEVSPEKVTLSGKKWMVGNNEADFPYTPGLESLSAYPVYVYYDKNTLFVHVSNGEVLKFQSVNTLQNIPVVRISTAVDITSIDKKTYVPGTITISDPENLYSAESEFTATMNIRGRGNSTWNFHKYKKPWRVKLDTKASVLGMPENRDWVLLANYADRTLVRNIVAMKLSEICGFSWTPKMYSVNVYFNDKYIGVYTLSEHKEVAKNKVNIDVVKPTDNSGEALEGGYYFEVEYSMDNPTCWKTSKMGVPMMFADPEIPTQEQYDYVCKYFNDFEAALNSSSFADPDKGYAKYVDVESFVNYFIIQELTKNIDGNFRKSTFITKERGKKLELYHVWDFDLTMGNYGGFPSAVGQGPENWFTKDYVDRDGNGNNVYGNNWLTLMCKDPAFKARLVARWDELLPQFREIPAYIDEQVMRLKKASVMNFNFISIYEYAYWVMIPPLGSYEAEVDYLKKFYKERLEWMDKNIRLL